MDKEVTQAGLEQLFYQHKILPIEPVPPFPHQSEAYIQRVTDEQHRIDMILRISNLEQEVREQRRFFKINTVFLNTLGSSRWEIKRPLAVGIEQRAKNDFVACLYDIDLYGYGDSVPESLEELKLTMVNQYEYLVKVRQEVPLSDALQKQIAFLEELLVPKNA
jgi:hypothetical protein